MSDEQYTSFGDDAGGTGLREETGVPIGFLGDRTPNGEERAGETGVRGENPAGIRTGAGDDQSGGGENQNGSRPRRTRTRKETSAAQVVLEPEPEVVKPTGRKVPADLMEFARTAIWFLDGVIVMAAPLVNIPETPPTVLKQIWSFDAEAVEILAAPVGQLLLKLPPKIRKRLETVSPTLGLVTAIGQVIMPRIQATQNVLAMQKTAEGGSPMPAQGQGGKPDLTNLDPDVFKN